MDSSTSNGKTDLLPVGGSTGCSRKRRAYDAQSPIECKVRPAVPKGTEESYSTDPHSSTIEVTQRGSPTFSEASEAENVTVPCDPDETHGVEKHSAESSSLVRETPTDGVCLAQGYRPRDSDSRARDAVEDPEQISGTKEPLANGVSEDGESRGLKTKKVADGAERHVNIAEETPIADCACKTGTFNSRETGSRTYATKEIEGDAVMDTTTDGLSEVEVPTASTPEASIDGKDQYAVTDVSISLPEPESVIGESVPRGYASEKSDTSREGESCVEGPPTGDVAESGESPAPGPGNGIGGTDQSTVGGVDKTPVDRGREAEDSRPGDSELRGNDTIQ